MDYIKNTVIMGNDNEIDQIKEILSNISEYDYTTFDSIFFISGRYNRNVLLSQIKSRKHFCLLIDDEQQRRFCDEFISDIGNLNDENISFLIFRKNAHGLDDYIFNEFDFVDRKPEFVDYDHSMEDLFCLSDDEIDFVATSKNGTSLTIKHNYIELLGDHKDINIEYRELFKTTYSVKIEKITLSRECEINFIDSERKLIDKIETVGDLVLVVFCDGYWCVFSVSKEVEVPEDITKFGDLASTYELVDNL